VIALLVGSLFFKDPKTIFILFAAVTTIIAFVLYILPSILNQTSPSHEDSMNYFYPPEATIFQTCGSGGLVLFLLAGIVDKKLNNSFLT